MLSRSFQRRNHGLSKYPALAFQHDSAIYAIVAVAPRDHLERHRAVPADESDGSIFSRLACGAA
jgi:hypothetical protein